MVCEGYLNKAVIKYTHTHTHKGLIRVRQKLIRLSSSTHQLGYFGDCGFLSVMNLEPQDLANCKYSISQNIAIKRTDSATKLSGTLAVPLRSCLGQIINLSVLTFSHL